MSVVVERGPRACNERGEFGASPVLADYFCLCLTGRLPGRRLQACMRCWRQARGRFRWTRARSVTPGAHWQAGRGTTEARPGVWSWQAGADLRVDALLLRRAVLALGHRVTQRRPALGRPRVQVRAVPAGAGRVYRRQDFSATAPCLPARGAFTGDRSPGRRSAASQLPVDGVCQVLEHPHLHFLAAPAAVGPAASVAAKAVEASTSADCSGQRRGHLDHRGLPQSGGAWQARGSLPASSPQKARPQTG